MIRAHRARQPEDQPIHRKRLWLPTSILAGASVVIVVALGILGGPPSPPRPRIGVLLPLSGPAAFVGHSIRDGIELAESLDPAEASSRPRVLYYDDQGDPRRAATAVQRLLREHHPQAVIGGAMSSTAEAIAPILNAAQTVLISPSATAPGLEERSTYFFRLGPSWDDPARFMAERLHGQLCLRRLALLYAGDRDTYQAAKTFARTFQALGGKVVSTEEYLVGAADLRTSLSRVEARGPEAVAVAAAAAEVVMILRRAQALGFEFPFFGIAEVDAQELAESGGVAVEGFAFPSSRLDAGMKNPSATTFATAFGARYDRDPDLLAARGFDAYRVLSETLRLSHRITAPSLRRTLRQRGTFAGASGTLEVDEEGHLKTSLRLMTIRNGRRVALANAEGC